MEQVKKDVALFTSHAQNLSRNKKVFRKRAAFGNFVAKIRRNFETHFCNLQHTFLFRDKSCAWEVMGGQKGSSNQHIFWYKLTSSLREKPYGLVKLIQLQQVFDSI